VNERGAAASERQWPAEIRVGPAWIVAVYPILDQAPARGAPGRGTRDAAVTGRESRAAQAAPRRVKASPALASWLLALSVAALASLAAWWVVR
jgi:hypothetical protein